MNLLNAFIAIHLKLKQYKLQFIFFFLFWFVGFLFFLITESEYSLGRIVLFSLTVKLPDDVGDFGEFYAIIWPILLEVIFFGFIMGELFEKYNPIVTSRILASHKRNHAVIIGYHHLSERIIEYCVKNKKKFVIIEDCEELVEDLLNAGHPIVIGDATENSSLELANVKSAKEIFININDVRIAIICTEKIRKINPKCQIYVRAFEDHVQEYLGEPPLNAFSFSTSKWAMDDIHEWTKNKSGTVLVIGRDHLTHRIAHHISQQPDREVYLFDEIHEGIEFKVNKQLHFCKKFACFLSDLESNINLKEVSQVFICWKKESEFDEAIYLTSKLNFFYPHIEVFVRIFDEELKEIVKKHNAKTFSTSKKAFKMLQKEVTPNSVIAPKNI
ncbi:MAG: NAD-binding protein [Candidatus Odinarchaeota archaeon]